MLAPENFAKGITHCASTCSQHVPDYTHPLLRTSQPECKHIKDTTCAPNIEKFKKKQKTTSAFKNRIDEKGEIVLKERELPKRETREKQKFIKVEDRVKAEFILTGGKRKWYEGTVKKITEKCYRILFDDGETCLVKKEDVYYVDDVLHIDSGVNNYNIIIPPVLPPEKSDEQLPMCETLALQVDDVNLSGTAITSDASIRGNCCEHVLAQCDTRVIYILFGVEIPETDVELIDNLFPGKGKKYPLKIPDTSYLLIFNGGYFIALESIRFEIGDDDFNRVDIPTEIIPPTQEEIDEFIKYLKDRDINYPYRMYFIP